MVQRKKIPNTERSVSVEIFEVNAREQDQARLTLFLLGIALTLLAIAFACGWLPSEEKKAQESGLSRWRDVENRWSQSDNISCGSESLPVTQSNVFGNELDNRSSQSDSCGSEGLPVLQSNVFGNELADCSAHGEAPGSFGRPQ